eukprot:CAMPEP_0194537630 /NCGR_PEP_ID=MMETSP0253-20130528/76961_1 /TAXON_ID=2966 /ORGANISM="Noctiluca scintillans" /LENGTH=91 /DNA_ID=CAMNT_0039383669 /DNA_START=151 /DNA_END=426 /DNA_ORIENTATION=-
MTVGTAGSTCALAADVCAPVLGQMHTVPLPNFVVSLRFAAKNGPRRPFAVAGMTPRPRCVARYDGEGRMNAAATLTPANRTNTSQTQAWGI